MRNSSNPQSGFKLVRWLLIVTLGCLLSVIFILTVTYTQPVQRQIFGRIVIGPPVEREFGPSKGIVSKELQEVINSQLVAFRKNDYSSAYSYAAATIKASLPLASFEQMVRVSYPVIAQSRSAEFGNTIDDGQVAVVNVVILGGSGQTRHYQYFLQRENSSWKISGVNEVKPPGTLI